MQKLWSKRGTDAVGQSTVCIEYTHVCTRKHFTKWPADSNHKNSNFANRQFTQNAKSKHDTEATSTSSLLLSCVRRRNTHTHTQDNYCNPRCACAPRFLCVASCTISHIFSVNNYNIHRSFYSKTDPTVDRCLHHYRANISIKLHHVHKYK